MPKNPSNAQQFFGKNHVIGIAAAALFFGFAVGWTAKGPASPDSFGELVVREKNNQYAFIHPLIAVEFGDKKEFTEYTPLENKIQNAIAVYKADGKARAISMYFRSLENGRWTGVNEDEKFSPASLYKVALMIAVFKKAEAEPGFLEQRVAFTQSIEKERTDFEPLREGQTYTIKTLVEHLIINSDNDAKDLLHGQISQRSINEVFSDLGLDVPTTENVGDSMSAKAYSRFFRTLYSSTYLTRPMSELALEILGKAKFDDGLALGVPAAIAVVHKFGYRVFSPPQNGVAAELHDCGIIYRAKDPYFLCVMTKGTSVADLKYVIQGISKLVYDTVAS